MGGGLARQQAQQPLQAGRMACLCVPLWDRGGRSCREKLAGCCGVNRAGQPAEKQTPPLTDANLHVLNRPHRMPSYRSAAIMHTPGVPSRVYISSRSALQGRQVGESGSSEPAVFVSWTNIKGRLAGRIIGSTCKQTTDTDVITQTGRPGTNKAP